MSIDFKLPELGENIESGDIVNVMVREGDVIAINDGVFELETDKAVVELPCPYGGKVTKIHVKKGQSVKVGQTLITIESETEAHINPVPPEQPKSTSAEPKEAQPANAGRSPVTFGEPSASADLIPAGPASRRLARELGVDLSKIAGSGKRGQVTPEDVKAAASQPADAGRSPVLAERITPLGEPGTDAWGIIRRERMSKIRRTIAAQMVKSVTIIPHVTNFDDADVTDLEHLRKNVPQGYLGEGLKLTMMPFVLKAVGLALQQHPTVNASLDDEKEEVIYKEYINIGVAVDTPRGLVVPVMRNVDRLSIPQIAQQLNTLAQKARAADFAVEDLRGGTFSISNLGAVGGGYSTPIINHPEAAVLLLGRSRWMPAVRGEKIEPCLMLPLSLSYDHRLVDGATAGRFLNEAIDYLQNPGKLLLAI